MKVTSYLKIFFLTLAIMVDDASLTASVDSQRRIAWDEHREISELIGYSLELGDESIESILKAKLSGKPWWAHEMTVDEIHNVLQKRLNGPKSQYTKLLALHLSRLARTYNFDPAEILALISIESSFRTNARSKVGAVGLMQVMPITASYIADKASIQNFDSKVDLSNPFVNLSLGIAYLSYLRSRFPKQEMYLASYNLGPTSVAKMARAGNFDLSLIEGYVRKIQKNIRIMRAEGKADLLVAQVGGRS